VSPEPTIPFADGPGAIGDLVDPVLVDPSPALLRAVIEAYGEAAPELVDPAVPTLRAAGSVSTTDSPGSPTGRASGLPRLTVLASDGAVDAVAERFRLATRLAALAETGVCDLLALRDPQPNAALVGRETGHVLVAGERRADGDADADRTDAWCRVGDDPTLRERYDPLVGAAEARRLRAPSRWRVYEAVRDRCDAAVADDVVRALDAEIRGSADEPLDLAGARIRAYVVGAHHGALDRDLRRACEDAGIGSAATFTSVKRDLGAAGVLDAESVGGSVGRSRDRLVARGALAEADGPVAAVAAALEALE
jgi:hypothetical protein